MKEGKIIDTANGKIPLPEALIQHIQSFLSREEAARTTTLSKSWYKAWLSRPAIDLDIDDFKNPPPSSYDSFKESAKKTMQRYQDSGLMIDTFRLRSRSFIKWSAKLIADAMKIGATDVDIELPSYTLPQEVVGSQTLVKLSICKSNFNGKYVSCSRLKSLTLKFVITSDGEFKHIFSCCNLLEELSLSHCYGLRMSPLYVLHKLRRLFLHRVVVESMFFTDFGSRFPCLKDLSVAQCFGCKRVEIASTSLETIYFKLKVLQKATFDVPNIRKFTYSGFVLPQYFSINGASREWEFDVSITCTHFNKLPWFLHLKDLLSNIRLSRVSLSINLQCEHRSSCEHEIPAEVVAEPLVVENLTINAPASHCCALLVRLFGICRPKLLTLDWLTDKCNPSLGILCKRLMRKELLITPDCGIPDRNMFGPFGLKKVNVEVFEMIYTVWRHLLSQEPLDVSETPVNKRKIQFECIWK